MDLQTLKTQLTSGNFYLPPPGVSLDDLSSFLGWLDQTLFDNSLGLGSLIPAEVIDHKVGKLRISTLKYQKRTATSPRVLGFGLQWDSPPSWELIPGALAIEEIAIQVEITGSSPAATLMGTIEVEGITLTAKANLPSMYIKAQMPQPAAGEEAPSPQKLFERFQVGNIEGKKGAGGKQIGPTLTDLLLLADPPERRIVFHLGIKDIEVGPLDAAFELQLNYNGKPKGQLTGSFWSEYVIERSDKPKEPVKIAVYAAHTAPEKGWDFAGALSVEDLPLGELIAHFEKQFGVPDAIPKSLANLELNIKVLRVAFNTATKDFTFSCDLDFFEKKQGSSKENVEMIIDIELKRATDDTYSKHASGQIIFHLAGETLEFDLVFDSNSDATSFLAIYKNLSGGTVDIGELVKTIDSHIDFPLKISLKDAFFMYEDIKGATNGTNGGTGNAQTNAGSHYLFGLNMGGGINMANLPLVGKMFKPSDTLKLDFQPMVASGPNAPFFKKEQLQTLAGLVPDGGISLPDTDITTNVELSINLDAGGAKYNFNLPIGVSKKTGALQDKGEAVALPNAEASKPSPAAGTAAEAPVPISQGPDKGGGNITWFDVQKSFGPVVFNRLGFKYDKGEIWVLMDAALVAGGLTLSLDGLGLGTKLSDIGKKLPDFTLNGLGIDFKEGPVEIGGSFLREWIPAAGNLDGYWEYDGMVVINLEEFNISALGSYARVNGHTSLFIYGLLEMPLGGPPFFFVTGLAAGFGYNRSILMPGITQVQNFPLVAQACSNLPKPAMNSASSRGSYLQQVMNGLRNYLPPKIGEYFLAVGVKFTTFELIDSFALVAVSFGKHFEVDVLGLSTLVLPTPEEGNSVSPLAEIQLAIKAVFDPDAGYLEVLAQLTNNSFLLSRNCHLTGGFAFIVWFKDQANGAKSGDFVLTLGGYHPKYRVPSYFPKVPRIGFNWQVIPDLLIKGSFYFALVPNAVMAGGYLEATWHSGSIKAWFKAGANFLLCWKPYFYIAEIYIDLGVSLTIHFFGTHHISVELGADLKVWGPDFSGIATIHLWIISFSIHFGSAKPKPQPIPWSDFRTSFLPSWDKMCSVQVQSGLLKKIDKTDSSPERWIVHPKEMVLITNSQIPATEAIFGDKSSQQERHTGPSFGVAPMALEAVQSAVHTVTVQRDGKSMNAEFTTSKVTKNMPAAMWGDKLSPDVNGKQVIQDVISGIAIRPAIPVKPSKSHPIERKNLAYDIQSIEAAYDWNGIRPFESDSYSAEWRKTLGDSINDPKVVEARNALLQDLGYNLASLDISINSNLANDLVEAPEMGSWTS